MRFTKDVEGWALGMWLAVPIVGCYDQAFRTTTVFAMLLYRRSSYFKTTSHLHRLFLALHSLARVLDNDGLGPSSFVT